MHAVIAHRPGPPDVLEYVELPDPAPGPGQVVVEVTAAAVVFVDTQMRAGTAPMPVEFPLRPGNGVAGRVVQLGDGVAEELRGAEVVTTTGGRGGYATRALAAAADLHRVPQRLGRLDAVALLADGRTAVGLAEAAGIGPGETVAVTAAAGGVGGLLVQLAVHAGARPVALAGSDRKLDHAASLGAWRGVRYDRPGVAERITEVVPDGLDVVFDGVGGATSRQLTELLRPGGRYLPHGVASGSWGDVDPDDLAARGVRTIPLSAIAAAPGEAAALTDRALQLAATGRLRPTIGQTFPLRHAAAAHAAIEARRTIGKTLLLTGV